MLDLQTSGTLGDAFILTCKISAYPDWVRVHHTIEGGRKHTYWRGAIRDIFRLARNVEEVIFEDELTELPRVFTSASTESDPPGTRMEFFPHLFSPASLNAVRQRFLACAGTPYSVICCHGGKPAGRGRNTKLFSPEEVKWLAASESEKPQLVVLLGTDRRYEEIQGDGTINLVGKTSVIEAMRLTAMAQRFTGTEGLLGFCALAHRVKSTLHYTSYHAVKIRVVGTPWAEHCALVGRRLSRWTLV